MERKGMTACNLTTVPGHESKVKWHLPTVQTDRPAQTSWATVSYNYSWSIDLSTHLIWETERKKDMIWRAGVGRLNLGLGMWGPLQWIPKEKEEAFPICLTQYLWSHLYDYLEKCSRNNLALTTSCQPYLRIFVFTLATTACLAPLNRATSQSHLRWKREVWWR